MLAAKRYTRKIGVVAIAGGVSTCPVAWCQLIAYGLRLTTLRLMVMVRFLCAWCAASCRSWIRCKWQEEHQVRHSQEGVGDQAEGAWCLRCDGAPACLLFTHGVPCFSHMCAVNHHCRVPRLLSPSEGLVARHGTLESLVLASIKHANMRHLVCLSVLFSSLFPVMSTVSTKRR